MLVTNEGSRRNMRQPHIFAFYSMLASTSVILYVMLLAILCGKGFNVFTVNKDFDAELMIAGLTTSVIVSVSEELIFRGLFFNYFLRKLSIVGALVSQSVLFAATHIVGSLVQGAGDGITLTLYFANMMVGGVLLGLIYFNEGTLIAPISFHLSWNFTAYNILGLSDQPSLMTIFACANVYFGVFEKDILTLLIFIVLLVLETIEVKNKQDSDM